MKRLLLATAWCFGILLLAASQTTASDLKVRSLAGLASLTPGNKEEVAVLLVIEAPKIERAKERGPVAVSLVIDTSGSMSGQGKIHYAREAGKTLVRSFEARDYLALISYDTEVTVHQALAPVTDTNKLITQIEAMSPKGVTFLSGGLEEGIRQLDTIRNELPSRVILLSDGLANKGVTGADQVAAIAAQARNGNTSVTSIGLGLHFQEELMMKLAVRGGGQYYYIESPEDLPSVFREELNHLVNSAARGIVLRIVPAAGVSLNRVYGYEAVTEKGVSRADLGDMASEQNRQVLFRLDVDTSGHAGNERELGTVEWSYTKADGSAATGRQTLTLPQVGNEKERMRLAEARKEETSRVRDEVLLLDAEDAHIRAIAELQAGNVEGAKSILAQSDQKLAAAPENAAIRSKREKMRQDADRLEEAARDRSLQSRMAKSSKASAYEAAQGKNQNLMQSGDTGYRVEKLQRVLIERKVYAGPVDGKFSPAVVEAVKAVQKQLGLPADGMVGPATEKALGL